MTLENNPWAVAYRDERKYIPFYNNDKYKYMLTKNILLHVTTTKDLSKFQVVINKKVYKFMKKYKKIIIKKYQNNESQDININWDSELKYFKEKPFHSVVTLYLGSFYERH